MTEIARRFKALSEEFRLRIVALLMEHGDLCVCEVERLLGVSQSAASRHFRYLASAGLIEGRREGQWVHYRMAPPENRAHAILLEALQGLFGTVEVPEIGEELTLMRARRCGSGPEEDAAAQEERSQSGVEVAP